MYYQPETHGSGVAFLDFDGDEWQDLYFLTFNSFQPGPTDKPQVNRLFRNAHGRFEDITDASNLGHVGYCHGVAVDDIDNDGWSDVFIAGYAECVLYHNRGDGTFVRVGDDRQPSTTRWATGAGFLDFDRDGDVDVYVCCYAKWTVETHKFCGDGKSGMRAYCRPTYFEPVPHLLYRNNGDGEFTEVSELTGVGRPDGRGLGVVAADVNLDGFIDLYIANDMTDNFLYLNDGTGRFKDVSLASATALSAFGAALASMGVDAEDLDGDLLPELFCTNLTGESSSVYHNLQGGRFRDVSATNRLGLDSRMDTGWGAALTDFDNDTRPDVVVTNGHVDDFSRLGIEQPLRQPAKLWHNLGKLRFAMLGSRAGDYFASEHVGRALAVGDWNNDGRLDVALNHLDECPALLENRSRNENHSITLDLRGTSDSRLATGAVVDLLLAQPPLTADHATATTTGAANTSTGPATANTGPWYAVRRQLKGGGSYFSANDRRLVIGLGNNERVHRLSVRWPDGRVEEWTDVMAGRQVRLKQGDANIEASTLPRDEPH